MKIERTFEVLSAFGGRAISEKQLVEKLGHALQYVAGYCRYCGTDVIDTWYVFVDSDRLEKRAKRQPFAGLAKTTNGTYSAISDCLLCGKSLPGWVNVETGERMST